MSYAKYGFTFNRLSLDLTNSVYEEENVHTEYEDKFIKKRYRTHGRSCNRKQIIIVYVIIFM